MEQKKEEISSKIQINHDSLTKESLGQKSKEELVEFITSNKHKLIQNKEKNKPYVDQYGVQHKKEHVGKKQKRSMDFSKVKTTRIAFKFSYIGKNYSGLVVQEDTSLVTVESKLFDALRLCCLIDPDPNAKVAKCVYARCGRTDKGVSALANVCSLIVRYLPAGDYCTRINGALPPDIRILAYAEISPYFDARFSCVYREYKYFFLKREMDIDLIRKCCKSYIGLHDFRNFCKKDESTKFGLEAQPGEELEQNYMRRIYGFRIVKVSGNMYNDHQDVYMAVIKGSAFLWHQVRCMMSILFMIGNKIEQPDCIQNLLNVDKIKERPNYDIAEGNNLILSDCGFEGIQWKNCNLWADIGTYRDVKAQFEESTVDTCLLQVLQRYFTDQMIKTNWIEQNNGPPRQQCQIIPNNKAGIDKDKPNGLHPWLEVMESIIIPTRANKRKEEAALKDSKKYRQLGLPNLTAMTHIQRAVYLAENPHISLDKLDNEKSEPDNKKKQKVM